MSRAIADLDLKIQGRCLELLSRCADLGHPLVIVQTLRTAEEQAALYAKGRKTPGPIVTWTKVSAHMYGLAFDVAFRQGTGVIWTGPWDVVGSEGEMLGLEWGGRWHPPDRPHFQLPDWRSFITPHERA